MTTVIGGGAVSGYARVMSASDDIRRLAAALEKPRRGYLKGLEAARDGLSGGSAEASRQLAVFLARVGDLTVEELRDLHAETFRNERALPPQVVRMAHDRKRRGDAAAALLALVPLLDRLEAERNPFVYVVRALCCLLLSRVRPSGAASRPRSAAPRRQAGS